ncbi:GRAM domain-containing protein [Dichotomocladium elegans]|nr:GRAM domain-containing protein [Dichotomocladium elegans]
MELANTKRNHDFHALFRSVPEDDPLIEDFGCALQKEILLQGRVYISEQHICFNANIFGWITNLVVAFSDIIEIEKKTTALFIPNAIQISTEQSKHFLTSFLSRDQAYDLIVDVWNQSKQACEDKRSKFEDDDVDDSDLDDESDEYSDSESFTGSEDIDETPPLPPVIKDVKLKDADRQSSLPVLPIKEQVNNKGTDSETASRRRAISEAGPPPSYSPLVAQEKSTNLPVETKPTAETNGTSTVQQTHEKTECGCLKNGEHFNKVVFDQKFPCSIETLYNLLYQSNFVKKFLLDQKNTDLVIGDWQKGDGSVLLARDVSYIKPLNGSIGGLPAICGFRPKSTKCLLTEEILHLDLSDSITQMTTTRTPDVPSGGSFCIKTRTCLMWAGFGQTRMLVTVLVDFQKSSWLKGPIESASISGQESYYNDLDVAIREKLSKGADGAKGTSDRKKHKRKLKRKHHKGNDEASTKVQAAKEPQGAVAKAMELASDGMGWVISNASLPSSTQVSVLCMLLLVIINLFIARKMAQVDQQLGMLKEQRTHSFGEAIVPNRHAQDDLWGWLSKIDPEHNGRTTSEDDNQDLWMERAQASRLAKEKLDRHMQDLEQMIQRAGSNMDQVTKMVDQQRRRILNNWTN